MYASALVNNNKRMILSKPTNSTRNMFVIKMYALRSETEFALDFTVCLRYTLNSVYFDLRFTFTDTLTSTFFALHFTYTDTLTSTYFDLHFTDTNTLTSMRLYH